MRDFVVELKRGHMLRNESDAIYNDVSNKLYKYYREGERDKAIKNALDDMHGDIYINIIPLFLFSIVKYLPTVPCPSTLQSAASGDS